MSRQSVCRRILAAATLALSVPLRAQQWLHPDTTGRTNQSMFRVLDQWPAANEYRGANGKPGAKYWQQRVDYVIRVALDTTTHTVTGSERVTYHNNAPDALQYLWFQLDQNIDNPEVSETMIGASALPRTVSAGALRFINATLDTKGYQITRVQLVSKSGQKTTVAHTLQGTQMKVPLSVPLTTGAVQDLEIDWTYVMPESFASRNGRGAREQLKDGWEYLAAQWFPRAAVYDDVVGWQNDQFYGQGEFYLNFGNYDVSITVPHNHIVQSTGVLMNPADVLTATQRERLVKAFTSETQVYIITKEEANTPMTRPTGSAPMTWRFKAENVRDFAWASSSGFIWDAAGFRYTPTSKPIEMHSLYPREALGVWDSLSTKAIAQTMRTYGRMSFEYPYPKASNIHGIVGGMEYPMIAFCGARPPANATATQLKNVGFGLVAVTIHEVGHNWFPMIVASDERKWTWMDEGLNSFLEGLAEMEFDQAWPKARLPLLAANIVGYLRNQDQVPLMTESDLIHRGFGPNGYTKPASGLYILREQVLGPQLFDAAFREYSQAWMFKHPQPADFFRSMMQASGNNLNWFWRGWFYSTHANDQGLGKVESQSADSLGMPDRGRFYNRVSLENKGGLVMPVVMEFTFTDGTKERVRLPVSIWRTNEKKFDYGRFSQKELQSVVLDPDEALGDINRANNTWNRPAAVIP
jgi:Peptidase family M1 domain